MAKPKSENTNPNAAAVATRGINFRPADSSEEIRIEAGEEIPGTVPAEVVAALIAEGSASR